MPEEYEVRDVTPMKQEMVWDEEGKTYREVPTDLVEVADFIGIVTVLPGYANPVGKDLNIIFPVPTEKISNPAGLAEQLAPNIVEAAEKSIEVEVKRLANTTS